MAKLFFWIDMEMSGLDPKKDKILEVAAVVTNPQLEILDTYEQVVFQPQEVLESMNDWCKKTHGESGLTAMISGGKPLHEVERELVQLAKKHYTEKDRIIIAGNSIGNDRAFIDQYLLDFSKMLHYRMVDVSSFKEIYRERFGVDFKKKNSHRAIDDIRESIAELAHYLSFVQMPAAPGGTAPVPGGVAPGGAAPSPASGGAPSSS